MLCLRPSASYRLPAYHAEYVVGDYGKFQRQLVGIEFAGRQPFQIHVCFYFAVELLAFPMCMVQPDDIMFIHSQVCPPGIGFDVTWKQELAILVDCTVNDLISCTDRDGFFLSAVCFVSDGFPVTSYYKLFCHPGASSHPCCRFQPWTAILPGFPCAGCAL